MNLTPMSIDEAVVSLSEFLLRNVPDGTDVEVTREKADEISRLAANSAAYGDGQRVDTSTPRQRYEAVGWLAAEVGAWFADSPYEDSVLDAWAQGELD